MQRADRHSGTLKTISPEMTCQGNADSTPAGSSSLKHHVATFLRWFIPLAIVVYLIEDVRRQEGFAQIVSSPKHWGLMAMALAVFLTAQLLTIGRWYWLVRALALPFRWNDAVRLGFLGYLLTFVSLGAIGGDVLKAVFIAREQPRRRIEAFATVMVDRVFGLYSLMLLATVAILASGLPWTSGSATVVVLCQVVCWSTGLATVSLPLIVAIGNHRAIGMTVWKWSDRFPKVAAAVWPLARALTVYRRDHKVLWISVCVGIVSQSLLAVSIWAIAAALVSDAPSFAEHLVIVPVALLTTMLPLPGYGLGALELAIEFLYRHIGQAPVGSGLLVAVGFRLVMVATALVSAVVYAANRREVVDVMRDPDSCEHVPVSA
jgi:hypothetical protein